MAVDAYLYFHSPCFDGIASSVLTWDYLDNATNWKIKRLYSVNYDSRPEWLTTKLEAHSAVVDFLYHPQACFWADHHLTTFLNQEVKKNYEQRKQECDECWLIYQTKSGSCTKLLWNYFYTSYKYRNPRYKDLVEWADKIDSARYKSVKEALFGDASALHIHRSLGVRNSTELSKELVKKLRHHTIDEVAQLPEVQERSKRILSLNEIGLSKLKKSIRLEDGNIAVFDVNTRDINRYAPYYFYPKARYSVGLLRTANGAKITAMRNPWIEFPSANIGKAFEKFGGGGHQRVGSIILPEEQVKEASVVLKKVIDTIKQEDQVNK
jgi:hypothetical protein